MNKNFKRENENRVFIALDDLRVGGIQRLALDEAYELKDRGKQVTLICFNEIRPGDSILELDGVGLDELNNLGIQLVFIEEINSFWRVLKLAKFIKSKNMKSVTCHSVSAVATFRAASLIIGHILTLNLWIHQVISISGGLQKTKRIIYSVFANRIFFSSHQFKLQWEMELIDRILMRALRQKNGKRMVSKLGVYIPRILNIKEEFICTEEKNHLIFASRLSEWKGFDTFMKVTKYNLDNHNILMSVNIKNNNLLGASSNNKSIDHVIHCKPPSFVKNLYNPVHIYPTYYGQKTKYPQSVGLNVLEFAILGIPSLVSKEVFSTYPELYKSGLVSSVDWKYRHQVQEELEKLQSISLNERAEKALLVREYCSIEEHVTNLLKYI